MADDRAEKEMVNADHGSDELEKKKNHELKRENLELKEKAERLTGEIEEMRAVEAEMKQSFEEMETEIEQLEEEKKGLESISARAVELEGEVAKIHEDLVNALRDGDEREVTAAELKKELSEKVESFERFEKEAEGLRKERGEGEKKGRDLERKVGVLEVRLMEERSKKVRAEEEMREKGNQKEGEIEGLKRKVSDFEMGLVKGVLEMESCEFEKKRAEEALSELKKREMELEVRKEELLKKVDEGEKTLLVLNERIMEEPTANGVRDIKDCDQECQWPVVAAGSVGALGLVAATVFVVCYSKRT
ncbi:hypothetical protein BRARA_E00306 [Brassica rapa]|uniref:Uncharacterized protein n=1 Tax=Brassica campestris TaxID=3711 RepID=A0A397Z679_BRACM|nr:hypothetical protein BRARA_E00306 [Brassica rapa]